MNLQCYLKYTNMSTAYAWSIEAIFRIKVANIHNQNYNYTRIADKYANVHVPFKQIVT